MTESAYSLLPRKDGRSWPAQGEWTYEEYLLLPEDRKRYEVIRGCLYVTSTFTFGHQATITGLSCSWDEFVSARDLGFVLFAPLDIRLPSRIADPVEPDVMFFRKDNQPEWESALFEGVPDLLAEILSPETCDRDRTVKLEVYEEAEVPEYWLVDPDSRTVQVYVWEKGRGYVEFARGGLGNEVWSSVLPGLRVKVADIFRP